MAFAAPVLVEGAAAGSTAAPAGSAAGSSAGGAAAGRAAAGTTSKGATSAGKASAATRSARPGAPSLPRGTAAGRADELHAAGTGRGRARRALMDEFGATANQADDLLDEAGQRAPAPESADEASPTSRRAAPGWSAPRLPTSVRGAAHAGGGLLLGAVSYTLALVFLRDGTAGVRSWFAAKFLNRTPGQAGSAALKKTDKRAASTAPTAGVTNAGSGLQLRTESGAGAAGAGASSSGGGGW